MVRAEVRAEEALHLMTSRRVFLCLFFPHGQLSVPDWTRRWPIIFPVPPVTPTALLHHGWGTGVLQKVFDRHHGDVTEAQRGGRVGQRCPSGEDYTQYLQLVDQRWWMWFLIKTWRHKLKSEKKIESGRNSSQEIKQINNIKNNLFATWNFVSEIFGAWKTPI